MTVAFRQKVIVKPGGLIELHTPQLPAGSEAEVIVITETEVEGNKDSFEELITAADVLGSDLPGLWKERSDIKHGLEFAKQLRDQSEHRDPYKT
jgi:hypothetical protein